MPKQDPPDDEDQPLLFLKTADYAPPSLPTNETLRQWWKRVGKMYHQTDEKPFIAEEKLHKTLLKTLDQVVSPPACGPLIAELELTVSQWLAEPKRTEKFRLIVMPPCDRNDVIGTWAAEQGHAVLEAPPRTALLDDLPPPLPDLRGGGLLVIPRLEKWFLRHHGGLRTIRELMMALHLQDRPCLVGCDSFAWQFLRTATGADLILPAGLTFQAFDAARLRKWFCELNEDMEIGGAKFLLSLTGKDVFEKTAKGGLANDHLVKLAARSRGIPWVAWHLWRASLRSERKSEDLENGGDPGNDERTLWVVDPTEIDLPARDRQEFLLVLHALLLHGGMTLEELQLTLPGNAGDFAAAGLIGFGFVELDGERFRCRPVAYPEIREHLAAAGIPVGNL